MYLCANKPKSKTDMKTRFLLKVAALVLLMATATTQYVPARGAFSVAEEESCTHVPGDPFYHWFTFPDTEGFQCQAIVRCTLCEQLLDWDDATVTSAVTREPTCEDFGEITYTATFSKPGFETQTMSLENVPPKGHTWGDPSYDWGEDDDNKHTAHCTASRECSVCHATDSEDGSVTFLYYRDRGQQTCTEGTGNTYEATFTNTAYTTQTWCTGQPPLGHNWNIPMADWTDIPTRHITCYRCDFERTVYATLTYDVITAPTCTMPGEYLYYATFDFPEKDVESRYYQIPCLGHEYDTDPTWTWSDDYLTATATFTCSRCSETEDANASVTHPDGVQHHAELKFHSKDYSNEQTTPAYLVLDVASANNWQVCKDYDSAYSGAKRDVLIQCTLIKDGKWNTLCLPFDVELQGSPLEGAIAKTLDKDKTVRTSSHIHLAFGAPATTLEAGIPYVIKWEGGDTIVNPRFKDVTEFKSSQFVESTDGKARLVGYYDALDLDKDHTDYYYMTSDSTLTYTLEPITLRGFGAYYYFFEDRTGPLLTFDFDYGDIAIAGIKPVDSEPLTNGHVYDLSGRRISTNAQSSPVNSQLAPGIYIVNGKKVLIK